MRSEGSPRHLEAPNTDAPDSKREPKKAIISGFTHTERPSPERQQLQKDVENVWNLALSGGTNEQNNDLVRATIRNASAVDLSKQDAEHILYTLSGYLSAAKRENAIVDLREVRPDLDRLRSIAAGERPPQKVEARSEVKEYRPTEKAIRDMRDFLDFANSGQIERLEAEGMSVEDAIYDKFYSEEGPPRFANESDPAFLEAKQTYDARIQQIDHWVAQMEDWLKANNNILGMMPSHDMRKKGWMYLRGNGGFDHHKPVTRAYLNIKPEEAPRMYVQLFEKLRETGMHYEMKLPSAGSANDFNRVDKIVIYFNDVNKEQVANTLKESYAQHADVFEPATPRFTETLQDNNGNELQGISFGEQPNNALVSFGEKRSSILARIYNEARSEGVSMRDPRFKLAERFQRACQDAGVDPENPAKNLRQPSNARRAA